MALVNTWERVDDLQRGGLRIIQNPDWFSFGIDAVLLSAYAKARPGQTIVDLCTGTGIVPLLLSAKTEAAKLIGVELQAEVADMARRSVALNALQEKIDIITADAMALDGIVAKGSVDVVTCNPPYFKAQGGIHNPHEVKRLSRHEVALSLKGLMATVQEILRPSGHFYMVHRPDRLVDILFWARTYKLEPKRLRLVHPKAGQPPNLVLIHFVKHGGHELRFDAPLMVYGPEGGFTQEIFDLYADASLTAFEAHASR